MSPALLETRKLTLHIGDTHLVQRLDLRVEAGDCLAILGRNGVGKSTLLHTLAGLRPCETGQIALSGQDCAQLPARQVAQWRGLLPQGQSDAFPATVLETALTGRHPHLGRWAWESSEDLDIARNALTTVGLQEMAERQVHTLSGGERQRLAIAALLSQQPRLYLLDEPLSHLDIHHQMVMLDLFRGLAAEQGAGVVMVLHDVNLAQRFCNRALLLFGEGQWEFGAVESILNVENLQRLFGHPFRAVADGAWPLFMPA